MKYLLTFVAICLLSAGSVVTPPKVETYLPNLRVPAYVMEKGMFIKVNPKTQLRELHINFAGENVGPGHLVMVGTRTHQPPNSKDPERVYTSQVVCDSAGKWKALPHSAGFFEWHAEQHNHWHWNTWAQYGLLRLRDWNVTVAHKVSFCLVDSRAARFKLPSPGQPKNVPSPLEVSNLVGEFNMTCYPGDSQTMGQRVSAGWMDIYSTYFNEPLPIEEDGFYLLWGIVDPDNLIREWNEGDNWSVIFLEIKGKTCKIYWTYEATC